MATRIEQGSSPIGILAGNGAFPLEVARAVTARGGRVVIAGVEGEAGEDLAAYGAVRVGWGEINKILRTFRAQGCRELVIVGGVTRPDLARIRFDLGLLTNLPELIRLVRSGGDDGVLRAVVRFFEARGLTVVSPAEVAPEIVVGAGPLGRNAPDAAAMADIALGSRIVRALAPFDIGQGVIVSNGRIEAIEAVEGTNRMIERVASLRTAAGSPHGILVKRPKPGQEMRVDLPAIGPETVGRAVAARLAGIAILAGQALVATRTETARRADEAGLFVYGFTESDTGQPEPRQRPAELAPAATAVLSRINPDGTALADAGFGAKALARITAACPAAALVVRRGHVLGIEPRGDLRGLFQSIRRHTQWGERRLARRLGLAVLGAETRLDEAAISAAAEARLAGIALTQPLLPDARARLAKAADAAGLFLIELRDGRGAA